MKDLKAKRKKEKEQEADAKFERLRQRKIRKKWDWPSFTAALGVEKTTTRCFQKGTRARLTS